MTDKGKKSRRQQVDLSDLRQAALDQEYDVRTSYDSAVVRVEEDKLFGMTAVERMFLSIGVFGLVLVVSMILLIVTDSIQLP